MSERGQGSGVVQGRSLNDPRHAAGAGATNTDPHHSGTEDDGEAARCGCSYKVTSNP